MDKTIDKSNEFGIVGTHKNSVECIFTQHICRTERNGWNRNKHYSLVSGGGNAWAQVIPGGVIEHLRNMSDRTVAHWTFFTNSGIMVASSFLPREWLSAQAQCMSLMAGWVSCVKHTTKFRRELITIITDTIAREVETSSKHNCCRRRHSPGCRPNERFSLRAWRVCMRGWDTHGAPCISRWWRAETKSWCATQRPALSDRLLRMPSRRSRTTSRRSEHSSAGPKR